MGFQTANNFCNNRRELDFILAYTDFTKSFIVNTDASLEGFGADLYYVEDCKKSVIAYAIAGVWN